MIKLLTIITYILMNKFYCSDKIEDLKWEKRTWNLLKFLRDLQLPNHVTFSVECYAPLLPLCNKIRIKLDRLTFILSLFKMSELSFNIRNFFLQCEHRPTQGGEGRSRLPWCRYKPHLKHKLEDLSGKRLYSLIYFPFCYQMWNEIGLALSTVKLSLHA